MKKCKTILTACVAVLLAVLCLAGCSDWIPSDISQLPEQDDTPTVTPPDSSEAEQPQPLPAIADAWERVPIVMVGGELYFSVAESTAAPTEVIGTVSGTVEQTALPEADWQTNCGLVGCEVYATEDADIVLVRDGASSHAFERPQPSEFAGSAPPDQSGLAPEEIEDVTVPRGLMWKGMFFRQIQSVALNDIPTDVEEIGAVLRDSYRISELDFSSNCGFVGYRIFRSTKTPNLLYIACDGEYRVFRFAG